MSIISPDYYITLVAALNDYVSTDILTVVRMNGILTALEELNHEVWDECSGFTADIINLNDYDTYLAEQIVIIQEEIADMDVAGITAAIRSNSDAGPSGPISASTKFHAYYA